MAFSPDYRTYPSASAATGAAVIDAGLRAYMLRVYNWMCSGLLLTGVVAFGIANTSLIVMGIHSLPRYCFSIKIGFSPVIVYTIRR